MFIVINAFLDLQDAEYLYDVGDAYPREGLEPSEERIKELLGSDNRQGQSLIKAVKTAPADTKPEVKSDKENENGAEDEPSEEDAEKTSDTPEVDAKKSKKGTSKK